LNFLNIQEGVEEQGQVEERGGRVEERKWEDIGG